MITRSIVLMFAVLLCTCQPPTSEEMVKPVRLITLDPGHFHAALIQKSRYPDIDSVVHVYSPDGPDLQFHLDRIKSYNTRAEEPTSWRQEVFTGNDFLERMITEKKGNVVVISGNNRRKTEYIQKSLEAGLSVLADKPMVIDKEGFEQLKTAFETAKKNNVLLYDIMTERFEITNILQREFSMLPEIFGTLEKGSPENPAITKESIHHFYKYVSGGILTRPAWFLDVSQQGEGIVDVMTHLLDLVQWECFPEAAIDYKNDIRITSAARSTTGISLRQFSAITKLDNFPGYLGKNVKNDTVLQISCNGEINYQIRGIHAKTSVKWNYQAPEGTGDTHYSIMRGTKANLIIRQGKEEQFKPTLYIEAVNNDGVFEKALLDQIKTVQQKYPGIDLTKTKQGWTVIIPEHYNEGHEAHFARVTQKFIEYLKNGSLPGWEGPNMVSKYFTTTTALELATQNR